MCQHCRSCQAEPRTVSLFRLCADCAYALCPGSDSERYEELVRLYGR